MSIGKFRKILKPGPSLIRDLAGPLLTEGEVAKLLRLSPATLRCWRKKAQRRGPAFLKIGGRRVVYRLTDVLTFARKGIVRPRQK